MINLQPRTAWAMAGDNRPRKREGLNMSLLEAMSCGIPVISTRHQEVAKILNDGNSISSNQIGVLGDAIISVCNNQDSHSGIGVHARKFIEQNYTIDSFVSNWNDLFEEARKLKLGTVNEILSI